MEPALQRGLALMNQGYVPYQGLETAAFNPQQVAGMQSANDWSSIFNNPSQQGSTNLVGSPGNDVLSSLPKATTDPTTGLTGYSSFAGYQDQLAKLKSTYPGLYNYITSFAIDPVTGVPGSNTTHPGEGGDAPGSGHMDIATLFNNMMNSGGGSASQEGVGNFWDAGNWMPGTRQSQGSSPFGGSASNSWMRS
jgi:hypothetical protein